MNGTSGTKARSVFSADVDRRGQRAATGAAVVAGLLVLAGCAAAAPSAPSAVPVEVPAAPLGPGVIAIHEPGLHPEDVEWDARRGRFLVSSLTTGSISAVDDDGTATVLSEGESVSTVGLAIDTARDRLLVAEADFGALADPSVQGVARLAVYDLESGRLASRIDLGALLPDRRHGANDVAVAPDGTAYVTDSLSSVVYAVDPDGNATVVVDDPRLATPDGAGLNGIAVHPDGHLLVAQFSGDRLFRVSRGPDQEISEVALAEPVGGDGLDVNVDGDLVVAAPSTPAILVLSSDDGWASADIVDRADTVAEESTTNTAFRDGAVYAVNAHFAQLGGAAPWPTFEIFRTALAARG